VAGCAPGRARDWPNSNATILYGHIEQRADRIHHMLMLREQQDHTLREWAKREGISLQCDDAVVLYGPDELFPGSRLPQPDSSETGYFQTIIPLPFFPNDSELERLPAPTGLENLRTLAIARLMLDNFPHVKTFWIMQTLAMAQFMLRTAPMTSMAPFVWYDITKLGGPTTASGSDGLGFAEGNPRSRLQNPSSATRCIGRSDETRTRGEFWVSRPVDINLSRAHQRSNGSRGSGIAQTKQRSQLTAITRPASRRSRPSSLRASLSPASTRGQRSGCAPHSGQRDAGGSPSQVVRTSTT
jgi:hypothetical protein